MENNNFRVTRKLPRIKLRKGKRVLRHVFYDKVKKYYFIKYLKKRIKVNKKGGNYEEI